MPARPPPTHATSNGAVPSVQVLTLDEADELIDDSNGGDNSMAKATFALRDVLLRKNPTLQMVLLSATFSESMQATADEFIRPSRNPAIQTYKPAEDSVGMNVSEFAVRCATENDKLRAIEEILGGAKGVTTDMAVIFCATKRKVKDVCKQVRAPRKSRCVLFARPRLCCLWPGDPTHVITFWVLQNFERGADRGLLCTHLLCTAANGRRS